jgi:pSer/pThr/pTyr-binding forkhead associated (FHA) protein
MYYKLVLLDNASGRPLDEWNLVLPATVGRTEDCSIVLKDPSISRKHCRFSINAYDAMVVQDLGSTNGVYVRDERVKQATIVVGETFQIGAMEFRVEMIDAPLPIKDRPTVDDSLFETQKVQIYEIP